MHLPMNQLGIVKRNVQRADKAAVEQLSKLGVATSHEAMGCVGLLKPYMRLAYRGAKLCGTTVTLLLQPGDNSGCCMWRPSNCSLAMWWWPRARRTASTTSSATCWPRPSRLAVPRA